MVAAYVLHWCEKHTAMLYNSDYILKLSHAQLLYSYVLLLQGSGSIAHR